MGSAQVARLRYFLRLVLYAPLQLRWLFLLLWDRMKGWALLLHSDFQWRLSLDVDFGSTPPPPPDFGIGPWVSLVKNEPKRWITIVKRAEKKVSQNPQGFITDQLQVEDARGTASLSPETPLSQPALVFPCTKCERTFDRADKLLGHMSRSHGVKNPLRRHVTTLSCPVCRKTYNDREAVLGHLMWKRSKCRPVLLAKTTPPPLTLEQSNELDALAVFERKEAARLRKPRRPVIAPKD